VIKSAESSGGKPLTPRRIQAISRALADPRRFEILRHIAKGDCSACSELRDAFPITPATLSHHLKELESALLIETTRRGKFVDAHFCREIWNAYLAALAEL
jgi:ArsR family transcriptional regulator